MWQLVSVTDRSPERPNLRNVGLAEAERGGDCGVLFVQLVHVVPELVEQTHVGTCEKETTMNGKKIDS